jgi:hypothetical protein
MMRGDEAMRGPISWLSLVSIMHGELGYTS